MFAYLAQCPDMPQWHQFRCLGNTLIAIERLVMESAYKVNVFDGVMGSRKTISEGVDLAIWFPSQSGLRLWMPTDPVTALVVSNGLSESQLATRTYDRLETYNRLQTDKDWPVHLVSSDGPAGSICLLETVGILFQVKYLVAESPHDFGTIVSPGDTWQRLSAVEQAITIEASLGATDACAFGTIFTTFC